MTDLIARIESADGPSRELDAEIAKAVGTFSMNGAINISPRYTASIDAALTLVPDGWRGTVGIGVGVATLWKTARWGPSITANASTADLALAAAALKARGV